MPCFLITNLGFVSKPPPSLCLTREQQYHHAGAPPLVPVSRKHAKLPLSFSTVFLPETNHRAVFCALHGGRPLLLLGVAALLSDVDLHAVIHNMGAKPRKPVWPSQLPSVCLQSLLLPHQASLLPQPATAAFGQPQQATYQP